MRKTRERRSPFRALLPTLLALLPVVAVAIPALGKAPPAKPCTSLPISYNTWAALPDPRGEQLELAAIFPDARCKFVGISTEGDVYATTDAGRTWGRTASPVASFVANGVVTENLADGNGLLFGKPSIDDILGGDPSSGLYLISDYGHELTPVPEFSTLEVTAAAVSWSNPGVMYVTVAPLGGAASSAALFKTTDGGQTWIPLPLSGMSDPDHVVVDPSDSEIVWAGGSDGLWKSTDGGASFTPTSVDPIWDVDAAPLGGGGTRVDAATTAGIARTRNRGASFSKVQEGKSIATIAHEAGYPRVVMAIVDGVPMRSLDEGSSFFPMGFQSVAGCTSELVADGGSPSVFVLSLRDCNAAGQYLYLSDGRDIAGQSAGQDGLLNPGLGQQAAVQPIPMEELRNLELPFGRQNGISSGSVAFDGSSLYFNGRFETVANSDERIFKMSTTGEYLGSFKPYEVIKPDGSCWKGRVWRLDCGKRKTKSYLRPITLTYDSTHQVLWMVASRDQWGIYKVDPETHRATWVAPDPPSHTVAYDPSSDSYYSFAESSSNLYETLDPKMKFATRCNVIAPVVASTSPYGAIGTEIAGGIPAGDGTFYLQMEDDTVILHVTRNCEVLAAYEHRLFAEAPQENDQIACDSTTFDQPAIWMNDAQTGMVAFAAPDALCPVPSRLRIVPETTRTSTNVPTPLCAVLTRAVDGVPISDAGVRLYVEDHYIGEDTTDPLGNACVTYAPTQDPGSHLNVHGAFLGNVSYMPSEADGRLILKTPRVPAPAEKTPPLLGLVPPIPPPPPPPQPIGEAPAPAVAPAPAPAPAPAQAPAQAQASNPQAVAVTQRQQQPQLAFVHAAHQVRQQMSAEHAMVRISQRRPDPLTAAKYGLGIGALSLMLLYGFTVATVRQVNWNRRG